MYKNKIPSKFISKLDLSNLNLNEIPSDVFELKNLRKLNLSNNNIKVIPSDISKLKMLEVLDISNNKITNFYAKICDLKKLKTLNLNNNKIVSIPKQISKIENLRSFSIANNKLKSLPDEFSNLSNLTRLNLSKNSFTEIPKSIYNLRELKELWISNLILKKFSVSSIILNFPKLKSIYTYSYSIDKLSVDLDYYELSKIKGNVIGKLIEIDQDLKYRTLMHKIENNMESNNINKDLDIINSKKKIFISYSHQDNNWLKKVQTNLKVLKHQNLDFDVWDDTKILAGHKWKDEIKKALETSKIAVLIISTDFLASDFIQNNELPTLLRNAEKQGCVILPLITGHSRFTKDKLSNFQAINDPAKPLSECNIAECEKILVTLADRVDEILNLNS
jgi:hypothetical protein